MLEVTKSTVILSITEIKGYYTESYLGLDNLTSIELSGLTSFTKLTDSKFKLTGVTEKFSHFIIITGSDPVGFISLKRPLSLVTIQECFLEFTFINEYQFAELVIDIDSEYESHINTEIISHTDLVNGEDKLLSTLGTSQLQTLVSNYLSNRSYLKINSGDNELVIGDDFSKFFNNEIYSTRLYIDYNLSHIIGLLNSTYSLGLSTDFDTYKNYIFLNSDCINGLVINTFIPITVNSEDIITDLLIISGGINNNNRISIYRINSCEIPKYIIEDVQKPMIFYYLQLLLINYDFSLYEIKPDLGSIIYEHSTDRYVRYVYHECTIRKCHDLPGATITPEYFDFGYVSYHLYNNELRFMGLTGQLINREDFDDYFQYCIPNVIFNLSNEHWTNIKNNYKLGYTHLYRQLLQNDTEITDLYVYDNFLLRRSSQYDYIYPYSQLRINSYNRLVYDKFTALQSNGNKLVYLKYDVISESDINIFNPVIIGESIVIAFRGIKFKVTNTSVEVL